MLSPGWGQGSWRKAGRGLGGSIDQARVKMSTGNQRGQEGMGSWAVPPPLADAMTAGDQGGFPGLSPAKPAPLFLGWGGAEKHGGQGEA